MAKDTTKTAVLYRMVMPEHTCPFGLKSKDLLKRNGYDVEDHPLTTKDETEAFKREHDVKTALLQTFLEARIGSLSRFFHATMRSSSRDIASESAQGPKWKARSIMRVSPFMSPVRLKLRDCPLRSARITSKPLIVA